jgi:nitrous oxidase accessory protein NosD
MREWTIGLLTVACVAAGASSAEAQCRIFVRAGHVAPGSASLGRSPEEAFGTIRDGAAAATQQGCVVAVGPGLYAEGNIEIGGDGVPERPITVRADPTGVSTGDPPGAVRVVPPDTGNASTGFMIRGRHDVIVDGFEISGFSDAGIQVRAGRPATSSLGVTIRNNVITNSRTGIDIIARDDVIVENNTTTGNRRSGISIEACLFESPGRCDVIDGGPVNPIVSNNRSGGNGEQGIIVRVADVPIIQNNVVYANGNDGIQLRETDDAVVVNNLVYANGARGISVGRAAASPNTVLLNNTIFSNDNWGIEIGDRDAASPGGSVVNNIVWQNGGDESLGIGVLRESLRPPSVCNYTAGFNLVLDAYGPETPYNVFDIAAEPRFVNPVGADGILGGEHIDGEFVDRSIDDDFRLREGSPAIDAGAAYSAGELGLTGSTAEDDGPDHGQVDLGYHYGADVAQEITYVAPFMPLYVRKSGNDSASGRQPNRAFATVGRAANEAQAGVTVVVGPGVYPECNLRPVGNRTELRSRGLATFLGDATGELTLDAPGPVVIEAGQCVIDGQVERGETGFDISRACGVTIDGFHITGAAEDGIRLDDNCDGAVVRNNVIFGNGAPGRSGRGVRIVDSLEVRVSNNLVYGNRAGIALGGSQCPAEGTCDSGSRKALLEFNTAWANEFNGIQIGDGLGVSSHATVRFNVTGENGKNGIEIGDDDRRSQNKVGFKSRRNLVGDSYGVDVRGVDDLMVNLSTSPVYIDPSPIDLTGNWLENQQFRVIQSAAGQGEDSDAVDYADITALAAGLAQRTTRSDGVADADAADLGYHYPISAPLIGDCDGDGHVRINELIMAVNIAIGSVAMTECLPLDADGNGAAAINEIIGAVNGALRE